MKENDLNGKKLDVLSRIPQRHLSEVEKQFIQLKLEQARLKREKARLILEKGVFVYVGAFTLAFFIKFSNADILPEVLVNLLVLAGIIILIVTVIPYAREAKKEETSIEDILEALVDN
ncbi:hypothetical protein D6783_02660 [Candidatus Woesearchaeota archaeon]|nr:MAG: hypothetical protein D6783_02660 [Candidatus Woesearchaeota archaeon]